MAHFAEIDSNNIVVRVVVINNNELLDENNVEQEQKGIDFCHSLFGGVWVQTSYNGSLRKNFAGVGYTYDLNRNAFIQAKPFESWVLDEATCVFYPPVPYPNDGNMYIWDESTISWVVRPDAPLLTP
jgi:hypothetical protein